MRVTTLSIMGGACELCPLLLELNFDQLSYVRKFTYISDWQSNLFWFIFLFYHGDEN